MEWQKFMQIIIRFKQMSVRTVVLRRSVAVNQHRWRPPCRFFYTRKPDLCYIFIAYLVAMLHGSWKRIWRIFGALWFGILEITSIMMVFPPHVDAFISSSQTIKQKTNTLLSSQVTIFFLGSVRVARGDVLLINPLLSHVLCWSHNST